MADLDRIMTRLDALEAENAALRTELDALRATPAAPPPDDVGLVSRRRLLRRAGVGAGTLALGVVGAGMATLAGPNAARAGTPDDPIDITTNAVVAIKGKSTHPGGFGLFGVGPDTGVTGSSTGRSGVYGEGLAGALAGVSGYGYGSALGLLGESIGGPSIKAKKSESDGPALVAEVSNADNPNAAVRATTDGGGSAVFARSTGGYSIEAEKTTNGTCIIGIIDKADSPAAAVAGTTSGTGPGVDGYSQVGAGVRGGSVHGRGGLFQGALAQIRLQPSTLSTKPASGQKGDLFVDKRGRLWFCKGGTIWKQLA